MYLERVDFRFTDNIIKALRSKEKIYSPFFGHIFYLKGQRSGAVCILVTIEHVFGIYFSIFGEYSNINFMNFSLYGLAASAWAVKKGIYPEKRARGMVQNLEDKLTLAYKEINGSGEIKEKKSLLKGIKLYRKGLKLFRKYFLTKDPCLLLQGHSYMEEGRKFLLPPLPENIKIDKYILLTLKDELEEQDKYLNL